MCRVPPIVITFLLAALHIAAMGLVANELDVLIYLASFPSAGFFVGPLGNGSTSTGGSFGGSSSSGGFGGSSSDGGFGGSIGDDDSSLPFWIREISIVGSELAFVVIQVGLLISIGTISAVERKLAKTNA
ncbi:hypothetical protein FA15DRAFT_675864 [Coprinopsis marcescibilis]|uniref:Uncharacterized protein n=1 Tax=Coprinopsis marcescibilis TaxID=230819 RepID=A0A5C3KDM1_COPMA|nr:hypothetical protein FA15DRAFT_675864 [Coprinopsis marcescibilis]